MCGIAGYTGSNPDMLIIKGLGILNDSRGGDSTGIYMNYEVLKGIHRDAEFSDLARGLSNHSNSPVLLHTRKSSSGTKTLDNTHPFEFNEEGKLEKGGRYVGVHNGTVYNWEKLKTNYDLDGDMDSKVLLSAFVQKKYEALKEYSGGAVLVLYDTLENVFRIWKGGTYGKEERPLSYVLTEDGFYFSSLHYHLEVFFDPTDVKDFKTDTVYTISEGQIINQQEIQRVGFIMEAIATIGNTTLNSLLQYCQNDLPMDGYYQKKGDDWVKSNSGIKFLSGYKRNIAVLKTSTPYAWSNGFEGPINVKNNFYFRGSLFKGVLDVKDFGVSIKIIGDYAELYTPSLDKRETKIDLLWERRKNILSQLGAISN